MLFHAHHGLIMHLSNQQIRVIHIIGITLIIQKVILKPSNPIFSPSNSLMVIQRIIGSPIHSLQVVIVIQDRRLNDLRDSFLTRNTQSLSHR